MTRKVEGETEYETVATQFHLYGSEGLGTYAVQAWVDTDVPNGKVSTGSKLYSGRTVHGARW